MREFVIKIFCINFGKISLVCEMCIYNKLVFYCCFECFFFICIDCVKLYFILKVFGFYLIVEIDRFLIIKMIIVRNISCVEKVVENVCIIIIDVFRIKIDLIVK